MNTQNSCVDTYSVSHVRVNNTNQNEWNIGEEQRGRILSARQPRDIRRASAVSRLDTGYATR
jgi:hypothetical protein